MSRSLKVWTAAFSLPALWMSGVWAATGTPSPAWAELREAIRARGLDPEKIEVPGELTEEMRQWAREQVSPGMSTDRVVRALLSALVDPRGLQLEYHPGFTGTAQEVFRTRRANCLAFTHLFVGMTRELGIPTFYVRWKLVERFHREGDLVVVSGHVSAGFGPPNNRSVLEFGAVSGLEVQSASPISDINALARHYANRSAELLRDGRLEDAIETAQTATRLDPGLADGWVNLGVAQRRSGNIEAAARAYRRATLSDPDHLPAYHNLSVLLELQGEKDAAREILALLDRRDNRNPFIYLSLGDGSLKAGRLDEAGRFYRKASRYGSVLAETRAARGIWMLKVGKIDKARKWLARAQRIDAEERRTRELEEQLSQVGGQAG